MALSLSESDRRLYTRVNKIPLFVFPAWLREGFAPIEQMYDKGVASEAVVAEMVRSLLRSNIEYTKQASEHRGIVEIAHLGKAQCDYSAILWVYLMRRLSIPARVAVGNPAYSSPEHPPGSYLLSSGMGHAWGQYFDSSQHTWVDVDSTSSSDEDPNQKNQNEWRNLAHQPTEDPKNKNKDQSKDKDKENDEDSRDAEKQDEREKKDGTESKKENYRPLPGNAGMLSEEELAAEAQLRAHWVFLLEQVARHPENAHRIFQEGRAKIAAYEKAPSLQPLLTVVLPGLQRSIAGEKLSGNALLLQRLGREDSFVLEPDIITLRFLREVLDLQVKWDLSPFRTYNLRNQLRTALDPNQTLTRSQNEIIAAREMYDNLAGSLLRRLIQVRIGLEPWHPDFFVELAKRRADDRLLKQVERMMRTQPYLEHLTVFDKQRGSRFVPHQEGEMEPDEPWTFNPYGQDMVWDGSRLQGLPPKIEQMLLLAGRKFDRYGPDRLEETTALTRSNPTTVEYLIFDLSGSMNEGKKIDMLNLLLAGFMSRAERQGAKKIILLPYTDRPALPRSVYPQEYTSVARELIDKGYAAGGGNNTALALSAAIELARNERVTQRVNFRLLTDGAEQFDAGAAMASFHSLSQTKIVNLSLVTLVDGNDVIAEFAKTIASSLGPVNEKHVIHTHITDQEIEQVFADGQDLSPRFPTSSPPLQNKIALHDALSRFLSENRGDERNVVDSIAEELRKRWRNGR